MQFSSESLCELHLLRLLGIEIWFSDVLKERNESLLILKMSSLKKYICHFAERRITILTFIYFTFTEALQAD